ncbi:MAG: cytochrome c oxidase subunit II [Geminicoccaceae bacterium]
MNGFHLFPVVASVEGARTDMDFWLLFWVSAAIVLLVLVLVVGFSFRYRRGTNVRRGKLPDLLTKEFEIGWTVATLFAFVFFFWWASMSELRALVVPKDALEIHVVAKQWMWKVEHPNGAREIDELHLPVDETVRLVMTSQDVIHDFYVPAFRTKKDVLPGSFVEIAITPNRVGEYHLFCAEYCGTDHSHMGGRVVVMTREAYAAWAAVQPREDGLAAEGAALFRSLGCSGCHGGSGPVRAPNLAGIYGRPVPLANGTVTVADSAYIRDSILQPKCAVAAGYAPIMPSFAGIVTNDELLRLEAYIKSLTPAAGAAP